MADPVETLLDVTTDTNTSVSTAAANVGTGEPLYLAISFDPGVTITSIFDNAGNSYSPKGTVQTDNGKSAVYVVESTTGNAALVTTVVFSGTPYCAIHRYKISTGAVYDTNALAQTISAVTTSPSLNSGTPLVVDELLMCLIANGNGSSPNTYTAGNGATRTSAELDGGNWWTSAVSKFVSTGTGAYQFQWTTNSESNRLWIVGFKPASGGGVTGSGALTLDELTVSGAGVRTSKGSGALTLDALQVAGAGAVTRKGTASIVLDALTVNGAGTRIIPGSGAITLDSPQVSGAGTAGKIGSGAILLDELTVAGAGVRTANGTGALTLDGPTVAGAGAVTRKGTGAILLDVLQVAGAGAVTRKGSGTIVLDAATVDGAGNVFSGTQGSGAIDLTALLVDGVGEVSKLGSGNIVLDPLQVAGAGAVTRKGSGAIVLAALEVFGYDVPPIPANAYYIDGTAFDENGRMVTEFIAPAAPLPTPVKYLCGIAHDENGARYVTSWPGGGQVRYIEGFAVRVGGVQIIATSGKVGANRGLPVTRRGELVVTENLPVRAVEGIGIASPAAVSVTNAS